MLTALFLCGAIFFSLIFPLISIVLAQIPEDCVDESYHDDKDEDGTHVHSGFRVLLLPYCGRSLRDAEDEKCHSKDDTQDKPVEHVHLLLHYY